jgi:hypothetical protein
MRITIEWLEKRKACRYGREWFRENFPDGGDRDEVLKRLEEVNRLDYYTWLLWKTLEHAPLPVNWKWPEKLKILVLDKGLLTEGATLPPGLLYLETGRGFRFPPGTVLPGGLKTLAVYSSTALEGISLPDSLMTLIVTSGRKPAIKLPPRCTLYMKGLKWQL